MSIAEVYKQNVESLIAGSFDFVQMLMQRTVALQLFPAIPPRSRQNKQEGCVLSTGCCADYNPCFKEGNKLGSSCCPIQTLFGRLQDASSDTSQMEELRKNLKVAEQAIHLKCNIITWKSAKNKLERSGCYIFRPLLCCPQLPT
jgi:hypothetical protein